MSVDTNKFVAITVGAPLTGVLLTVNAAVPSAPLIVNLLLAFASKISSPWKRLPNTYS